ncbi:hypothetical protein Taro_055932 [Colocasia esculenta]|uniref:Uncharacterized protein n=1 Tax=Colocasia esculenta TaxID=4460 RepID=A0A843XUQ9_COLES|nr:hypothetical protein [Colocasia esculenta]
MVYCDPGQGSEDHRQSRSYDLDGLRPSVTEERLLGVPLSSLGYWTMAGEETYDRTMVDRYVDATRGPRKGRVYGFGDSLDTTPVLSYASLVAPPAYVSSSAVTPDSGGEDIRTLIQEELSQQLPLHLGAMVEQLVAAIRGAGPSQQAPQSEK